MSGDRGFTLRRIDQKWYAGRGEDGMPIWTEEFAQAHLFTDHHAAMEAQRALEQAGIQTHVFMRPPS